MARLLAWFDDVLSGGPILRRRPLPERRGWDSVAEILAMSRPRSYAGVPVDDESAMRLSAVWGCVDLIAELVSTLPVDEYKRVAAGPPILLPSSPLLVDPAGDGYGFEVWARQIMESWLLRGNSFGFVVDIDDQTYPKRVEVLHPDRVSVRREGTFGPVEWRLDNKPVERWPFGPLWHVPVYNVPGSPVGRSAIRYAAETIGLGLATGRFGAQWFGDGAHPTAVLEGDEPVADETEAKMLKQRIMAATENNREPLILGGGWKLNSIQVAPDESQFLETIQANADDVARFFFRRPPGEGGEITYANVEARSIDLLTYTLNGWLVRFERALSRLRPRGRFVKFNADALLRVALKDRYEAHVLAIRGGFATVNERRALEDMEPFDGGDELLWPPYTTTGDTAETEEEVVT